MKQALDQTVERFKVYLSSAFATCCTLINERGSVFLL